MWMKDVKHTRGRSPKDFENAFSQIVGSVLALKMFAL